jgi:hypothetical protein
MIDSIGSPVRGFAQITVATLRVNGFTDAEILAHFTDPDDYADERMEAAQLVEIGIVYAPAADVKAMIRLLVLGRG